MKKTRETLQWISVQEQLPEIGEEVFVFLPDTNEVVGAARRHWKYPGPEDNLGGCRWERVEGSIYIECDATHWMPMPKAPEKDL